MNKLLSSILILFTSTILFGQSNTEDLDQALQLLCDSPASEPFFQVDTDEGISMVLVYGEAKTRDGFIPISENLRAIRYELATNFYCPIVIISELEYRQLNLRVPAETSLVYYRIVGDQMNLILRTTRLDNAETYSVDYHLEKKFDSWEIINEKVTSTRR